MNDNDAGEQAIAEQTDRAFETLGGYLAARPQREAMALQVLLSGKSSASLADARIWQSFRNAEQNMSEIFAVVDGVLQYSREHPPK